MNSRWKSKSLVSFLFDLKLQNTIKLLCINVLTWIEDRNSFAKKKKIKLIMKHLDQDSRMSISHVVFKFRGKNCLSFNFPLFIIVLVSLEYSKIWNQFSTRRKLLFREISICMTTLNRNLEISETWISRHPKIDKNKLISYTMIHC